jgi:peroxin-5
MPVPPRPCKAVSTKRFRLLLADRLLIKNVLVAAWYQEFRAPGPDRSNSPAVEYHPQPAYRPQVPMAGDFAFTPGFGPANFGMMHHSAPPPPAATVQTNGKARFVELDDDAWEEQFAKIAAAESSAQGTASAASNPQLGENDVTDELDKADNDLLKGLQDTWKSLQENLNSDSVGDDELAAWEAQYGTSLADLDGNLDLDSSPEHFTPADLDALVMSKPEYPFVSREENPYADAEDPFAEGQRLLAVGAPLAEAALAFEEACRRDEGRGEAWRALGDTCAADEKEIKAIRALERAVGCEGEGGEGAWMSLAISYVNEGYEIRALATLDKWLEATYPEIAAQPGSTEADPLNPWDAQQRAIEKYLAAARAGPAARKQRGGQGDVDPDVQVGLGVLFYSNSDYKWARDCFEAALSVRPDVRLVLSCLSW